MGDYGRFKFRREIVVEDEFGLEEKFGPDTECMKCGELADGVLAYYAGGSYPKPYPPEKVADPLCEECAKIRDDGPRLSRGIWEKFRRSSK